MTGIQTESIGKKTTKVDINDIGKLILNDATELTIASAIVTATQSYHVIDTEGDAATDDLETINGGTTGQTLVISAINGARTVVVKDSILGGNLRLTGDMSLDTVDDTISLIYDGSHWLETARADNSSF